MSRYCSTFVNNGNKHGGRDNLCCRNCFCNPANRPDLQKIMKGAD